MRILFDLTYCSENSFAGVEVYAYRLLEGLKDSTHKLEIYALSTKKNSIFLQQKLPYVKFLNVGFCLSGQFRFFNDLFYKKKINNFIALNKIDLYCCPFAVPGCLTVTTIPSVAVIHDVQPLKIKNGWKQKNFIFQYKRILKKFDKIVTISNYAKNDLIASGILNHQDISVIYNSLSFNFVEREIDDTNNSEPYILNVNTLEPYKNLITLVKAFALLKDTIPHSLLIKAKRNWYWDQVIVPCIKQNVIENRVVLLEKTFNNTEMNNLYQHASLFVSPSLMEGFGYTPIEAALNLVPVVCSKESALFETTRGLLNYYEPSLDESALANQILETLKKKNPLQLKNVANEYMNIYSVERQVFHFINLFNVILGSK